MSQERPLWESELVDEAVRAAEKRYEAERERASRRASSLPVSRAITDWRWL